MKTKLTIAIILCLVGVVGIGSGLAKYFNSRSYYVVEQRHMDESYERRLQFEKEGGDELDMRVAYEDFKMNADTVRHSKKMMMQSWLLTGPGLLMLAGATVVLCRRRLS